MFGPNSEQFQQELSGSGHGRLIARRLSKNTALCMNIYPIISSTAWCVCVCVHHVTWSSIKSVHLSCFLRVVQWYWHLDQSTATKHGRAFSNTKKLWLHLSAKLSAREHMADCLEDIKNHYMYQWRKGSERRKHCALAVVRWSQKFSPRRRPPSRGCRTAKI